MAEPFDELLKEALMQAMEEDLRDLPEDSQPMSDRQRRRMEQLLADPDACRAAVEEAKAALYREQARKLKMENDRAEA